MRVRRHVEHSIGHNRSRIDRRAEVRHAEKFLLFAGLEYSQVAVFIPHIHLPIRNESRAPHMGFQVVGPIELAGFSIEAMKIAGEITDEEQSVRSN